jgi:methylated-DNA-[protein]-cysteine S-methyltransferase
MDEEFIMRRKPGPIGTHFILWHSPVGWLGIVAGPAGLVELLSHPEEAEIRRRIGARYPLALERADVNCREARDQLAEYFAGGRRTFELACDFSSLTSFSRSILERLREVPAGTTVSYGQLAARCGRPGAARAVGRAMAGNPFPIVIPCHRVVGADGTLTGYSGGEGLATKEWLLTFERSHGKNPEKP